MLTTQQIFNKIFRNEQGEPSTEILAVQQIFNRIFDESKNALRIFGALGLLKTGQTAKYHDGDDGDLELGVAHDYTVLSAGQYAGTTNITINGKTHALSNNCVQDNRTGKTWARYVPNADIGPANNGQLFWKQWTLANKTDISFDAASKEIRSVAGQFSTDALCAGRKFTVAGSANNNDTFTVSSIAAGVIVVLETVVDEAAGASIFFATVDDLIWDFLNQANANSLGGHSDWRIPNYHELPSIIDIGHCNPAIDTTAFPSTPSDYHWAASTNPCNSATAFLVHFSNGHMYNTIKEAYKGYVRVVRG